ncbi:hypothetical protein O3M35_005005 [Rhynocoris fuscipes]|uniref:Seipin n=1 Tax=Rhynocoris fuscipes TaxID=488301 RepID=A0AAW1DJ29_9HEMI
MIFTSFFKRRIDLIKKKTVDTANVTLDSVIKGGVILLFCITIIWVSIFLYVLFYYTYIPSIEHVKSVNLQFTPCEKINKDIERGVCSFPSAHVQLTKSNQLLMVGQPYRITLVLELPESERNKNLGMFLVCAHLSSKGGVTVSHSCRSTMLRYKSQLLQLLTVLTLTPFYVSNILEEKQTIAVELFSNFEEDQVFPVTDVYLELKSERVEVYSSKLQIDAHLTGIRYLMFHWPAVSAAFGVSFNLAVIAFIVALSWWQLYGPYPITVTEDEEETEEDEEPKVFKLKNSFDEDDEEQQQDEGGNERKFLLERKLSSSEA